MVASYWWRGELSVNASEPRKQSEATELAEQAATRWQAAGWVAWAECIAASRRAPGCSAGRFMAESRH